MQVSQSTQQPQPVIAKGRHFHAFFETFRKLDDWAKMLNDLDKKDTDCKSVASVFGSQSSAEKMAHCRV